jgi:hypothetical protein
LFFRVLHIASLIIKWIYKKEWETQIFASHPRSYENITVLKKDP